jgi:hypothetical protein
MRGEKYQRFEVGDGDCFGDDKWNDCETARERVEFTSSLATTNQQPMGNQCFGFSIMLDDSFQSASPTNTTLGQIQQAGGPKGTMQGFRSVPPIIQFDVINDYYNPDLLFAKTSNKNPPHNFPQILQKYYPQNPS